MVLVLEMLGSSKRRVWVVGRDAGLLLQLKGLRLDCSPAARCWQWRGNEWLEARCLTLPSSIQRHEIKEDGGVWFGIHHRWMGKQTAHSPRGPHSSVQPFILVMAPAVACHSAREESGSRLRYYSCGMLLALRATTFPNLEAIGPAPVARDKPGEQKQERVKLRLVFQFVFPVCGRASSWSLG